MIAKPDYKIYTTHMVNFKILFLKIVFFEVQYIFTRAILFKKGYFLSLFGGGYPNFRGLKVLYPISMDFFTVFL
jgi:hypothetical protein